VYKWIFNWKIGAVMLRFIILFLSLSTQLVHANFDADWSVTATIPEGENRANVFNLTDDELKEIKIAGYNHAGNYPITVTGLLIPYRALMNVLESNPTNPLRKILYEIGKDISGFRSEKVLYQWLGLFENNSENETGIYKIPFPNGKKDNFYLGAGIVKKFNTDGLTFSCYTCHANNLFGKMVVGLTNKRPRANSFFHMARGTVPHIPGALFKLGSKATPEEVAMFQYTKKNLVSVEALEPQVLGLDTSLSQIALSLAHRNQDAYATKSNYFEKYPRYNELQKKVVDSKPMPWWNVKYKTRWLADGSIVAGNPIYTNFLWNEIGRGTDLVELEDWMKKNESKVNELTAAVFATEAPLWTDFFGVKKLNIEKARRGEMIFNESCASCHGTYEKAWSRKDADQLSSIDLLKTEKIIYHKKTPVKNVGTDPARYEGMKYFADDLNKLAISKMMKTVVVPQKGYVPPPLVGIWARYPYFHNNSIPNLCALVTRPELRPKTFVQGPSLNAETDYDFDCVGYPVGQKIPTDWQKDKEAAFNTTKPGLSNMGHFEMFVDDAGNELYSKEDKMDLIEFLKTL
jgi:mono/diheme cytochrome c family protein